MHLLKTLFSENSVYSRHDRNDNIEEGKIWKMKLKFECAFFETAPTASIGRMPIELNAWGVTWPNLGKHIDE